MDELLELHRPKEGSTPELGPVGVPLEQAIFPAGYRAKLMTAGAELTTHEGASHLLGMTERVTGGG